MAKDYYGLIEGIFYLVVIIDTQNVNLISDCFIHL